MKHCLPYQLYTNKTVAFFQTILKECGIVHFAFLVSFLSNISRKALMTCHRKIHVFPSRRSVKNYTCLNLLHANVRLKTRGVEGLLPKLRAFLIYMYITLIIFLQSRLYIEYTLYLCVMILHLKLCLFCI